MACTIFCIFVIIYLGLYGEKYLVYMYKIKYFFLSLLQVQSKCILTKADRQKQSKTKISEINTSGH